LVIRARLSADLRGVADGCGDFVALTLSSKQSRTEFALKRAQFMNVTDASALFPSLKQCCGWPGRDFQEICNFA
jgi:hypothetical protein